MEKEASLRLSGKLQPILPTDPTFEKLVHPDRIYTHDNIALVAVVGCGMVQNVGTSARVFKAIADAKINVNMIDQGSSELNIIIGVENEDKGACIRALYNEFFS